ncbi:uncharacterized protein LOC116132086 [Pistacia vera]|uniref:uncharacterized protein LOC116132086 n=1 Tax=Pistacia vera TaxID=55513 RepID=UPI00126370DC|nr:uncharacterized protein LOC116132086 [Pistacia vera]XP_031273624.1 uncharacterized protein LOC116132086 [Pistacia vera]
MKARNSLPEFQGPSNCFKVILPPTLEAKMLVEYPISDGEEPESGRRNFGHQNNMESDEEQSVEILGSTTPNSSFRTSGNNFKDKSRRAGPSRNVYSPTHKNEPRRATRQAGKQAVDKRNQLDHQEFYGFLGKLGISISEACREHSLQPDCSSQAIIHSWLF